MSRERVADFASELPARLREDVVGYARSVEAALPDIFRDAGVTETPALRDQLVLIAGVKKLYAICSSAFWILDRSLSDLEDADVRQIRLGSIYVARGSQEWLQLRNTLTTIEGLLSESNLLRFMYTPSYRDILIELTDGR